MRNPICVSVNYGLKLHKCDIPYQNTFFLYVLQLNISFVLVSTLTIICTNAIIHCKIRFFECFAIRNPICVSHSFFFRTPVCEFAHQQKLVFFAHQCANSLSTIFAHQCANSLSTSQSWRMFAISQKNSPINKKSLRTVNKVVTVNWRHS